MKGIGHIIRKFREEKGITRDALSAGICSSKYIYYIENDQRHPSMYVLTELSQRLRVDLVDFIPYLECENPIEMKRLMEEMEYWRKIGEFGRLYELIATASSIPDFEKDPWKNELEYNKAVYSLLYRSDTETALKIINNALSSMGLPSAPIEDELSQAPNVGLRLYMLLAIYNDLNASYNEAVDIMKILQIELYERKHLKASVQPYISLTLNLMHSLYQIGEYSQVIKLGEDLNVYSDKTGHLDRQHLCSYLLTLAYYRSGNLDDARYHARKMMHLAIAFNRHADMKAILLKNNVDEVIEKCLDEGVFSVNLYDEIRDQIKSM